MSSTSSVQLYTNQSNRFVNLTNNNQFNLGSELLEILTDNALLGNTTLSPSGITNTITGQTLSLIHI
jgi:hypothetical protein